MHRHVMGLMALVVGVAFGVSPTPALAQVGQSVVQHDTYVQDGPVVAASCVASGGASGSSTTTVVSGYAVAPGAFAIRLGCGIIQGGRVVRSFQNALPGSVAATGGTATLALAPYSVCLNLYVSFIDGSEVRYNGCP